MDIRTREAVRYLGYGRHAIDERTLQLVEDSFKELEHIVNAKFTYRIFETTFPDRSDKKLLIRSFLKYLCGGLQLRLH